MNVVPRNFGTYFPSRRIVSFFVLLTILFSLSLPAAAQTSVEEWAAGLREKYAGVELRVAVASHPSTEAFKAMIPSFEEMTGIRVILDEMEEGALGQRITLEYEASQPTYDIVMTSVERNPRSAVRNYIQPIDAWVADPELTPEWFDYEDILQAYRDMYLYEGQYYAVPFAGETVFLFYRKDLFEKYEQAVPTTFDEVMATAEFFNEREPGLSGVSFRARVGWEFAYTWSIFLFPFGGMMVDPATDEPMFTSEETRASLQYMIDLKQYGPLGMESFSFPEAWDSFMLGRAAMMIEASAAAPEVENPDKSLVAGNVGYARMPAGPAGAFSGVWGWGYGVTTGSANPEAAWSLIVYLTSKEMQEEYLANGGIVSRQSALGDPEQQALLPYYGATLEALQQAGDLSALGLSVVLPSPLWVPISDVMGNEGGRAFAGEITVEAATDSIQAQVIEILGQ